MRAIYAATAAAIIATSALANASTSEGASPSEELEPLDAAFCQAESVSVRLEQKHSKLLSTWLYSLTGESQTSGAVRIYVSVYDDDGNRQNAWEPRLASGETRVFIRDQPMPGPNQGHVSRIKYRACPVDRATTNQCSAICRSPP